MAVVAAMVGCQRADEPMVNANDNKIVIDASIVTDDTRVTVGGENYTEVSWEVGDVIRLESKKGMNTTLTATASGKSNVRFEGAGSPVAEVDTYYAVYPNMNVSNGTITLNYAEQSGDDVALLAATPVEGSLAGLQMSFSPVNALLHVKVTGGVELAKAEFINYGTETDLNTGKLKYKDTYSTFTYNYTTDDITFNATAPALVVNSPSADGFFFRLAPGLEMSEGYIIRLTDVNGNVCSKAYKGKTFERGTTTRVEIDWTLPSVTLGAKTSYSYYLAGDSETANKCGNTEIFFVTGKNNESCASSYAGVQDAMITDLGYEIDGVEFAYSDGKVSWDKGTNTFCINDEPKSCNKKLGEKTAIKAFVVVEGKKYESTNYVWLTGLPYKYNFVNGSLKAYENAGWTLNGSLRVADQGQATDDKLVLYSDFAGQKANGYIVSPKFYVPATGVNVQPQLVRYVYASIYSVSQTGYVGAVSSTNLKNTSSVSVTDKGSAEYATHNNKYGGDEWLSSFQINSSNPYISISCSNNDAPTAICHYFLFEAHFRYAE